MSHDEPLTLRTTVIAGIRYADDYAVVWRGLSIGRIMKAIGAVPYSNGSGTVTSTAGRRPPTTAAPATILTTPRPSFGRHGRASAPGSRSSTSHARDAEASREALARYDPKR